MVLEVAVVGGGAGGEEACCAVGPGYEGETAAGGGFVFIIFLVGEGKLEGEIWPEDVGGCGEDGAV